MPGKRFNSKIMYEIFSFYYYCHACCSLSILIIAFRFGIGLSDNMELLGQSVVSLGSKQSIELLGMELIDEQSIDYVVVRWLAGWIG